MDYTGGAAAQSGLFVAAQGRARTAGVIFVFFVADSFL